MKIVADSHIPFLKEYFGTYGELKLIPGRDIQAADVKDADILLVRSITTVDKNLLAGSSVKFVGSLTAGADHLDTAWLDAAQIPWSIAAGFNAPPVADYVVSTIAALSRKRLLTGRKAVVIGAGHVGRLVIDRLRTLNFEVQICDPIRAEQENNFTSIPLSEISDTDFISIHVPLTKEGPHKTYHFIDESFLKRQKPGAILLNASRGSVMPAKTLLAHGKHLKWCIDVWEREPHIDQTLLQQALIATPHIAGYSVQSKIRGIDMLYQAACAKKIITPQTIAPILMPHQQLIFSSGMHHWQDIVLGIFNPLIMTAMLRTLLLSAIDAGKAFDELRNKFTYRHEFAFTQINALEIVEADKKILEALGIKCDTSRDELQPAPTSH